MKNWVVTDVVMLRCNSLGMQLMLVGLWTLDSQAQSSHGANTSQMGNRYGRGLIEPFVLTNGYNDLQIQRSYT